jgi:hypothetical protein
VRELSRKAFDLRNQQKKELANAIATVEGTSKEKALQRVQRAQHTKEMFARLPSIKPKTSSGISMIKVPVDKPDKPKEALVWKTITNATDVETAILNQQKLHFSQAKDTPFAKEPLKHIFNWSGTSHHAERVLSRRHHVSSRPAPPTLLKPKLPEPSPEITLQAMKQKYRNWSEGTSTSPSGRHLGHKHALLHPCGLNPNSPDFEKLDTLRKTIWSVHHGLLNFSLRNGYCYNRWKTVVTTLIEKDPTATHAFIAFESSIYTKTVTTFYLVSPITTPSTVPKTPTHSTKATMDHAHAGPLLTQLALKCYTHNTAPLLDFPPSKFSNDAAACLNQIVLTLSSIISRSYSIPNEVTRIQADMLKNAVYPIKTLLGVSTCFYSHNDDSRAGGMGQGGAASDRAWGFNSSTYFDLQDQHSHGAT